MFQYLLTYRSDGYDPKDSFVAKVVNIIELAKIIGFSDCSGDDDFSAYRLIPGKDPERLRIDHDRNFIYLFDRYGNYVDSAEYDEH